MNIVIIPDDDDVGFFSTPSIKVVISVDIIMSEVFVGGVLSVSITPEICNMFSGKSFGNNILLFEAKNEGC